MLTQEEYVDLLELRRQGLTLSEIAERLGYHRTTIGKWLRSGGPPAKRATGPERIVLDECWKARIDELLSVQPALLATSIFELIRAEGFAGSYPTVVRHVRSRRGPRFRAAAQASLPIETAPGQEAQFDWTDCTDHAKAWGWPGPLWCFGAILCWVRWRLWWFTAATDREHTFEGLVRFFEAAGGVPRIGRTDRMGALGRSQGKRFVLHPLPGSSPAITGS
jgi:transposase